MDNPNNWRENALNAIRVKIYGQNFLHYRVKKYFGVHYMEQLDGPLSVPLIQVRLYKKSDSSGGYTRSIRGVKPSALQNDYLFLAIDSNGATNQTISSSEQSDFRHSQQIHEGRRARDGREWTSCGTCQMLSASHSPSFSFKYATMTAIIMCCPIG